MHTILGLLGVAVFIPCVIALAAGMTWAVVRISPPQAENGSRKAPPASS